MEILDEVLINDKFQNINIVKSMLENELLGVLKNYLILEQDVVIRYRKDFNKYIFNIEVVADRIKPMGVHYE